MPVIPIVPPFWVEPVTFGSRPIPAAVQAGAALFRSRKDADEIWSTDEVSIGTWFDGRKKRSIERLFWISPLAVSRRLGFLQAQEGWPDEVLQSRWLESKNYFGHRVCFVARICSFPKNDVFEGGEMESVPALDPMIPSLRVGARSYAVEQTLLEERGELTSDAALSNWIAHPAFDPLKGALDSYNPPGYSVGPFRTRLLFLTTAQLPATKMDVVISTQGKQRVAQFDLVHPAKRRRHR